MNQIYLTIKMKHKPYTRLILEISNIQSIICITLRVSSPVSYLRRQVDAQTRSRVAPKSKLWLQEMMMLKSSIQGFSFGYVVHHRIWGSFNKGRWGFGWLKWVDLISIEEEGFAWVGEKGWAKNERRWSLMGIKCI